MELNSLVKIFLEVYLQFKICHWQTKSYARHLAFGGIYDTLDDLIDKYVEVAMGKQGRFELSDEDKTIELENLSELDLNGLIKNFKNVLTQLTDTLGEKDTDLLNIKDEMLAEINKLAYLLTLE